MQDRYAGDIGDFGKFSLLRFLFDSPEYQLGVIWYLFPNEQHNTDGRHTDYLDESKYVFCDPELCSKLKKIIITNGRKVKELEKANILPPTTIFYSEPLDFHLTHPSQTKVDKETRLAKRRRWLENAAIATSSCNVLFMDPDNGLEVVSYSKTNQLKAGKYIYFSEIRRLAENRQVSVIYHHLNRHSHHGSHQNQINTKIIELRNNVSPAGSIYAMRFKPYSPRAFFILTSKSAERDIQERIQKFKAGMNKKHWDCFATG